MSFGKKKKEKERGYFMKGKKILSLLLIVVMSMTSSVNGLSFNDLKVMAQEGEPDYSGYGDNVIILGKSRTFHVHGVYKEGTAEEEVVDYDYTIELDGKYEEWKYPTNYTNYTYKIAVGKLTYHFSHSFSKKAFESVNKNKLFK